MSGPSIPAGSPPDPQPGPVRPSLAVVFATALFVALMIGGTGVWSLYTETDPIVAPSFGQLPGVIGGAAASLLFAGVLWLFVRQPQPSYWTGVWTAGGAVAGYLGGVAVMGAIVTTDIVLPLGVVERLVTTGFAVVVLVAGLVSGWGGVAAVRSRGRHARWPWEH